MDRLFRKVRKGGPKMAFIELSRTFEWASKPSLLFLLRFWGYFHPLSSRRSQWWKKRKNLEWPEKILLKFLNLSTSHDQSQHWPLKLFPPFAMETGRIFATFSFNPYRRSDSGLLRFLYTWHTDSLWCGLWDLLEVVTGFFDFPRTEIVFALRRRRQKFFHAFETQFPCQWSQAEKEGLGNRY